MGTADVSVSTPRALQKAPVPTIDIAEEGGTTINGEHADPSNNEEEEGGGPWETDSDTSDSDKRVAMDKFDFQYASGKQHWNYNGPAQLKADQSSPEQRHMYKRRGQGSPGAPS